MQGNSISSSSNMYSLGLPPASLHYQCRAHRASLSLLRRHLCINSNYSNSRLMHSMPMPRHSINTFWRYNSRHNSINNDSRRLSVLRRDNAMSPSQRVL